MAQTPLTTLGGLAAFATLLCAGGGTRGLAAPPLEERFTPPERDYILACGGCHGFTGVSNPALVPNLKGRVGYYLYLPEGRAYLARLPNVAFSTLSDEELAAVLNYMVFELGEGSAPAGTSAYTATEVSRYRRQPLTEVALSAYRRDIVETLIDRYRAPETLRGYGGAYP